MAGSTRNPWEENYSTEGDSASGARPWEQSYQEPEKPKRTWGEAIKDTGAQLAEGVNTTLGAIPSVVAPQSKAAGFFRDNTQYWRDQQSDVLKGRIAETDKRIAEAGKDGVLSQIGTAASEYWNDPAQAARLVATNLPSMAATLGTGAAAGLAAKGVAAARGLDAANKAALAAKYGTTTAYATNAALNAGGARGEAFEDLQKSNLAQGMTPEQAEQAGVSGSIMPGVVGGVAGALSGKIGLEKAILGQATKGAAMRKAAGAFGAELAGEQIEELAPKVATNYQVGQIDPGRTLTDDLGRTMVETAIGSGPGAVVAGGAAGMRTGELPPPPGAGEPTTSPGAADPNAPVPPGAAPVEAPDLQATAPAAEEAPSHIQPEAVEPAPLTPEQRMAELDERMRFIDQQAKANGWDKRLIDARDETLAELDALRGPAQTEPIAFDAPETDPARQIVKPSVAMGLDPSNGPLTAAAAMSVDSGLGQQTQFLGATGRDVQLRQTGPGVTDESNVIDVDAREVPDQRGIPTARRLTNEQDGGARATSSQPLAMPAPTNLREGLERIRAQRQEAANAKAATPQAAPAATAVPAAGTGAVEAAGLPPRGREGYDTPVTLDAASLKALVEKTRGTPLVDKPEKLEAWRNGTAKTDPAKFPIELAITPDGRLDVNDGRHRIALAAERGETVEAFIDGKDAHYAKQLVSQPSQPTGATSEPQAPQAIQAIAQQQEEGNQAPVGAAATTATQPGATGGGGVQAAGVKQRAPTPEEARIAAKAEPMLDLKKAPTGWKRVPVENGNGVVLVSYDGKQAVPFFSTNVKSGTEGLRASAKAQAYAIDNPYQIETQPGELVFKPVYKSTESTNEKTPEAVKALAQPQGTPAAGAQAQAPGNANWAALTPEQRRRARLEHEIATGQTNNGGVVASLRPSAIEKRKQELAAMGDAGKLPSPGPAETREQRAQRVAAAGEAWTRMPTVEREAMAGRADGLNPMQRKSVQRAAWADLSADIQRKLADTIDGRAETGGQQPAAPAPAETGQVFPTRDAAMQEGERIGGSYTVEPINGAGRLGPHRLVIQRKQADAMAVRAETGGDQAAAPTQQAQAATKGVAKTPKPLFSDPRTGMPIVVPNKATADAMARSKQLAGKAVVRKATPAELADQRNTFTGYNPGEDRRMGYVLELPQQEAPPAAVEAAGNGQDDKAIRYELPPEKYAQQQGDESWMAAQSPSFKPTVRQQLLMDAVAKALDDGAFYNSDVDEHVAKALGVTLEQRARNSRGVEGGDFGYDVYNARKAVEAQRSNAKSREFANALNLNPGDALGTLIFNDGKVTTGVKVIGLNESGLIVTITGKRGSATLDGEVGVDRLAAAMDRAKERGKRKDGYAEFVAGRGAVQPSPQDFITPAPASTQPAQEATDGVAMELGSDALELKTDEVMEKVVVPGMLNLTRDQVRALIQEKGVKAADKTIADYQESEAKQAETIRRYSDAKDKADRARQAQAVAAPATQQPITRADVETAKKQAAAIIGERIDAMTAGEVNKIAKQLLPTMGKKATASKERNKAAMTDSAINLEAAAAEVGVTLPAEVKRALQADMEGTVADGDATEREAPKAKPESAKAESNAGAAQPDTPAQAQATGPRRDPTKVSMFNPYEDGDIVTIDGQNWTVKQDTPGWYLTNTGNWRGTHPTIRNIKAMADLIRAVEQASVAQKAAAPQPDTPKLTPAEAKSLMAWEDMGQKDGVKTHALTFYESQADKDAKRGRMIVARVTKEVDSGNWTVEGTGEKLAVLGMAKKKAEQVGMEKAVADGFVQEVNPFAEYDAVAKQYGYEVRPDGMIGKDGKFPGPKVSIQKGRLRVESSAGNLLGSYSQAPASIGKFLEAFWYAEKPAQTAAKPAPAANPAATNERNAFTLQRLNRETGQMEPVTFERGEYVRYAVGGKDQFGDIDGISQARKEFSVDGLWYPFGFAYKAERPAAPERKDAAPLSEVIDKMNAKHGAGLTDADRVPEQKPASKTPTVDRHNAAMAAVRDGKATAEQFRASFEQVVDGKAAIVAELDTMTKVQLLREGGPFVQMRYANEKKADVVDAVYREMLGEYALGESVTYGMARDSYQKAVRRLVEATDADKLARYVADRKAAAEEYAAQRAAKAAALENPQTLTDYRSLIQSHINEGKTRKEAFLMLTPEQRIQYDTLEAEGTKEARESRKRAAKTEVRTAGQTTGGEIIATKHTRDGYDLFVVKLADRLSADDYKTVLASAKKLGGWYSAFRGNGAIPGFQFKDKTNAEAFLALAGGDTTAAQEQVAQRRDAFEDDRSQGAAERLNEMAGKLEESADEEINRDRKANTARRARFASAVLGAARAQQAMAKTMRNIAKAIEDGRAKFLDAVRTKTQVEMLTGFVRTAKDAELRAKYDSYADQEKRKGEPPTAATADFAEFPAFTAFRSDLATLARQMLEVDGTKKLGQQLMKVADDVTDAYLEFAKGNIIEVSAYGNSRNVLADFDNKADAENAIRRNNLTGKAIVLQMKRGHNRVILSPSEAMNRGIWKGDGDKRITLTGDFGNELVEAIGRRGSKQNGLAVPWQFQTAYDRRKALARIGIETASEFRSALREFVALQETAVADKVRDMELAMVGRKADGLDFFPTPAEVADQMVEAADIQPDMAVLEPSAGMGHIAERIREAGVEPDVVEMSVDRRELLEAKGFNLVASDFMDTTGQYDRIIMNPPFSNRRDAEHVRHAYSLLKPGGRIVAIMGEGVFFGNDKKAQEFREWLESVGGTSEKLPDGSFLDPSLPVTTGANARMVVIDKAEGVAMFSSADSTLPAKPLSLDRVNQLVQEALAGIRGAPPVEVTARPGDIGLKVPAGSVGYGVTLRSGDIYVFQSAMGSDLDVFKTVFHELFHRGVRVLVPKAQYVQTMLDLAKGDSRIQQLAIEWKNTEMGQKQKDNLRKQGYTGADLTGQYEALAIEETLAAVAEEIKAEGKLGSKPKSMTIRFLANWLAKVADMAGMKKLAQGIRAMTYNEAERFVMSAIDRSGAPVPRAGVNNMSAKQAERTGDQTQTEAFSRAPQSRSAAIKEMLDAQAAWDKMKKGDAENITLEKFSEMTDRSINARTALADELVSMPDDGFALQAKTSDGRMLILTPSAQKAGKWQLTRFGSDGAPWGDTNFDTKKQAALEFIDEADLKTIQGADNEGAAFSRTAADQTQTEAFKRWFAGSKVVDADGNPLRVYHGTASDFSVFSGEKPTFFFTSSPGVAGGYAGQNRAAGKSLSKIEDQLSDIRQKIDELNDAGKHYPHPEVKKLETEWDALNKRHRELEGRAGSGDGGNVMPVYLAMKNPLVVDFGRTGFGTFDLASTERIGDAIDRALGEGHDGVVVRNTHDSASVDAAHDVYIAFTPTQVKSAIGNNGNFDPDTADIRFRSADQTQTDAFKRWFAGSRVVDADGKPMVVYHGTTSEFNTFRVGNAPGWGRGIYFTDNESVARDEYAGDDGVVVAAYVSLQNPYTGQHITEAQMEATEAGQKVLADGRNVIDASNEDGRFFGSMLRELGYDGVMLKGSNNIDGYEIVAFRPEQIKSAIGNNGDFDPTNPDIRFRSADMGSRAGMSALASKARDELNRTFSAPGKLSWWHKTVGTMYNLAERSPVFKRVFDSAQGFVDDVSHYATDAAELAPKLLPKLETWRDIAKRPISAADNAAVAKPVFEGTLDWSRDEAGKPVRLQVLLDAAEKLTPEQKAQRLLRNNKISEGMLKAWQGLPLEQYEKLVASRYESQMLKAGIVWTPAELKAQFKLTDAQVELYQEFRAATDRSLDTMARSDMLRFGGEDVKDLADMVMDAASAQDAAQILRDHLLILAKENPDRAGAIGQLANGMLDRAARVQELQEQGYAPLSRFGKYTVDVVDAGGERQYFGLFETAREANIMAMKMRKGFGQDAVTQGTLSDEEFKLLAGITPESLELFGNMLGLDATGDDAQDQAFQEYLRRTKTNRSAMRRLIHRQGIAGYSEDVGRVLASFIYSNARQTSAGLHMGELGEAITQIPKQQGELKDAAIQLSEYVKNPQEEAQMVRGLLFAQYLGGSIASAFVNMTQPVAVSFPWLSQFGGAKQAAAELGRAAKNLASRGHRYEADLAAALKHAEEEGTVSPQEVHQLMAQARGSGSLRPGDGTRAGDARAAAGNALTRMSLAWGKVFGAAEQVNRRMTFIAAYRVAKAQGMANPAAFAKKAVVETQFTYSKANKMKWGRGAVGATVMTFKTYSIAYIELLHRMYTQGGPEGKQAVLLALAVLMLMGGAGGLPFAEDAEDLVDGLAQMMGYNFSSKKAKQELLESVFGEAGAGFVERGITGLPGMPLDVSGRLGMGNLLPGTGIFKEKTDHTRDVLELVGPVGDLAKRVASGGRAILTGDVGAGLLQVSPVAVRNAAKGADMAARGMYRDDKGYKVLDTTPTEAAMKAIGFQPASVSKVQDANFINQQAKNFYSMQANEIRALWARGIFEQNQDLVEDARARVEDWNRKNPDQRMVIAMPAVFKRVREMSKTKDQRIADTAPKAMRQALREESARARAAQ